jgi:hypothetical protein
MLVANNEVLKKLDPAKRTRCEVWTRVMGYHRPVSEFNLGKKGEHEERTHYIETAEFC